MEVNGKVYRNLEGQVGYLTDKYDDLQNQINDVRSHLTHYVVVDTLPTGDDIDPSAVYLLGPMGTAPDQYYEEWVYVQKADESWMWEKLGDTDSVDLSGYLPIQDGTTTLPQVYEKTESGEQAMLNVDIAATALTIPLRDANGRTKVAAPSADGDAVNKKYCDDGFVAKQTGATPMYKVYGKATDGTQGMLDVTSENHGATLVFRDANGRTKVAAPAADEDVVNKRYADDKLLAKQAATSALSQAYTKLGDGTQFMMNIDSAITNHAIVQRTGTGQINVPATPTDNAHAASKAYVDAAVGQLLYLHDINLVFTIDASNYLIVRAHLVSGSSTAITSLTREQFARMNVEYGSYGTSNNASNVSANAICSVAKLPGLFRFDAFDQPYTGFLYQYVSGSSLLWGVADNTMTVTVTDVVVSF